MKAFVTGVTGQDGRYLTELLHTQGYEVWGLVTGHNPERNLRTRTEFPYLHTVSGDLLDMASVIRALEQVQPDEVYNLAAISHVGLSFDQPELTVNVTGLGTLRLLEACRLTCDPKFFQASSSEMFGNQPGPQTEETPFAPRSPYGAAKCFAHHMAVHYRERGMHACCGISFNHESPRRGTEFVTRKITRAAARIKLGLQDHVTLGNLDAQRDWGFAGDYVQAMHLMLQHPPDDYVLATGVTHTVREFAALAFKHVGLDWENHVRTDPVHLRPTEVHSLRGDASKARKVLGWELTVTFSELVAMMVDHDLHEQSCRL